MRTKLTFTNINKEKRYSALDPEINRERLGDYDLAESVLTKWRFKGGIIAACANVAHNCSINIENRAIIWGRGDNETVWLYNLISSSLLLYRLIALFGRAPVVPKDRYKTIWWFTIEHIETGKPIMFGEWKGTAEFWVSDTDYNKIPETYRNDLEDLLLFLVSDQLPHPYDNTTAGQIA